MYCNDGNTNNDRQLHQLKVHRVWFRGKNVFTERLYEYERKLIYDDNVIMRINAGNMIYVMLRRLGSTDFKKQDALIASYRDLMYKLSYVNVVWYKNDRNYFYIEGEKSDVMWALAFVTQVFPDEPLCCETVVLNDTTNQSVGFQVQDGSYSGENMREAQRQNDVLPNIWTSNIIRQPTEQECVSSLSYSKDHVPNQGDLFAIMDGRLAYYIRMDERYLLGEQYKDGMDAVMRHNISASCIKDFQDLVRSQKSMEYDLYRLRYIALMNKVQGLEHLIGGFEVSCYDILPIGERGIPYASEETLKRTNNMDCGSLRYYLDKMKRNKQHLTANERKELIKLIGHSVLYRIDGYDIEYQTYMITGSFPDLCAKIRMEIICKLYADFAEIESYGLLDFPDSVYRALCNDPENASYQMTPFEKQRLQVFGRGYFDFLNYQLQRVKSKRQKFIYSVALKKLKQRYIK